MGKRFARGYDRFMAKTEAACLASWRAELLAGLSGTVVEIGAGTGANLAHYPATVERLVLGEPDPFMREQLEARLATTPPRAGRVEVVDAPAGRLPLEDGEADAVVSTLVLCSVPDPRAALAEVRRVLRPGGTLHYVEHVVAPEKPRRHLAQRLVEPVWKRVAGGCHLTRDTLATIEAAGFDVGGHHRESMRQSFSIVRTTERGAAVRV